VSLSKIRDSSVSIAAGYGLNDCGSIRERGQETFLYLIVKRPTLGSTQLSVEWVPGTLSPRVNRPRLETDHSPLTVAENENCGAIRPLLHTSSWRGA
jgi:hypothetical protein